MHISESFHSSNQKYYRDYDIPPADFPEETEKRERPQKLKTAPRPRPKPLTAIDERSLVWRWQHRKDQRARALLLECFRRPIERLAKEYPGRGLELGDRITLGSIGFLIALDKFDIKRGWRLWTFAKAWARAEIQAATAKSRSVVCRPRKKKTKPPEISGQLGWQWETRWTSPHDEQLDSAVVIDDERTSPIELLTDDTPRVCDGETNPDDFDLLRRAVGALTGRQKRIFVGRRLTDNPLSLREIGAQLGISAERVRQIENAALATVTAAVKRLRAERGNRNPSFPRSITLAEHTGRLSQSSIRHPDGGGR